MGVDKVTKVAPDTDVKLARRLTVGALLIIATVPAVVATFWAIDWSFKILVGLGLCVAFWAVAILGYVVGIAVAPPKLR